MVQTCPALTLCVLVWLSSYILRLPSEEREKPYRWVNCYGAGTVVSASTSSVAMQGLTIQLCDHNLSLVEWMKSTSVPAV